MAVATRATAFAGKALPARQVRVQVRKPLDLGLLLHSAVLVGARRESAVMRSGYLRQPSLGVGCVR